MEQLAKFLFIAGAVLLIAGGLVYLAAKMGIVPGHLPGDIRLASGNMTCVIALGTSILLSIILTVVLNIIIRIINR